MPPHVLSDFVVSHPLLWLKYNRLLKLGRPVGAVTLSLWEWRWSERWIWGARGALNLISTNCPEHGHHGRLSLSRKNAYGRVGNGTRDPMVSSQKLWPPSHEAGNICTYIDIFLHTFLHTTIHTHTIFTQYQIFISLKLNYHFPAGTQRPRTVTEKPHLASYKGQTHEFVNTKCENVRETGAVSGRVLLEAHIIKNKKLLDFKLTACLNAVCFLPGTSPASEGVVISAAKEETNGDDEFGFLDLEFSEYSNVLCSFLPIKWSILDFKFSPCSECCTGESIKKGLFTFFHAEGWFDRDSNYISVWLQYLFTPWSRVLLEKLTGSAGSQEIPRIFRTRRFITYSHVPVTCPS